MQNEELRIKIQFYIFNSTFSNFIMSPKEFYQHQSEQLLLLRKETSKRINLLTFVRLVFFLLCGLAIYFSFGQTILFSSLILGFIVGFLVLVTLSNQAKLRLEKTDKQLTTIASEIESIESKRTNFDNGEEYLQATHPYANDLDLFAPTGVFSFFNRTTSKLGKDYLAQTLLYGSNEPEKLAEHIQFLSKHIAWTQQYRTSASIASREKSFNQQLKTFSQFTFVNPKWLKIASIVIPVVSFSTILLSSIGIIGTAVSTYLFIACIIPTGLILKDTNLWYNTISNYDTKFKIIKEQLELLEELDYDKFQTQFNIQQQKALITDFLKIISRFEVRLNMLLAIPINLFFAWDIRQRLALEKWAKQQLELEQIEEFLAEVEVLISAATVYYHYEDETNFCTFSDDNSNIELEGLNHPILPKNKCVSNDFSLSKPENFIILTGPNMAGKSTYLRAVGLAIVFANAGFPIFAKKIHLPKLSLFSSMRTADDLSENSSYFYAELSRLKMIKDTILQEKQVFILLDEILKGTNSKDKEEGSRKFLLKINQLGARGIIATHDLSLCEISHEYDAFTNYYFDSTISKNELSFDYRVKAGICQNMNASFLLKKMELID
jgi:hypothetical protein